MSEFASKCRRLAALIEERRALGGTSAARRSAEVWTRYEAFSAEIEALRAEGVPLLSVHELRRLSG